MMPQLYHDSVIEDDIIYRKRPDNTLILTGVKDVICKDVMNDIVIPEYVRNIPVTAIADAAFCRYNHLYSIKLPATLTHVGKNAFAYCQRLKSVHFKSPTVTIEQGAFCGCGKLQMVSGWSLEVTDLSTFEGCSRLEKIDAYFHGEIKLDTFLRCKRLKELYFDDGIVIRKNAFIGCMSLEKMTFGSKVAIDNDAMDFIAKRTIVCLPDCPLVELGYTGTNIILKT